MKHLKTLSCLGILTILSIVGYYYYQSNKYERFSTKEKLANEIINAIKDKNLTPIKDIHCGITPDVDRNIMDKILTVDFFNRIKSQNWENAKLDNNGQKASDLKIINLIENGNSTDEVFYVSSNRVAILPYVLKDYYCFAPNGYEKKSTIIDTPSIDKPIQN
jgi:hypothetical protein